MTSPLLLLLFVGLCHLTRTSATFNSPEDEFTFDLPDDVGVESKEISSQDNNYVALVGRVFHLTPQIQESSGFTAKETHRSHLPHWLMFNKKTGVFWGVPLPGDEDTVNIVLSTIGNQKAINAITIHVVDSPSKTEKCQSNEDETILTLLLDKNIRAIKPRQRVVAVSNLAKFFRLPYSAFTLKPQMQQDDISDSSVVLAGPGNVQMKSSKSLTLLEVPVGCDGRLWETTASLMHGLKQEARDGTIAEVLRIPVLGWRVKTEAKAISRKKRQAIDDYGSGDYDEDNYEDYEEYDDEEDLGDLETDPPVPKVPVTLPTKPTTPSTTSTTSTTTTTTTTTTPTPSSSHPHRHHHGEIKPSEEYSPIIPVYTHHSQEELVPPPTPSTPVLSGEAGPTKVDIMKPKPPPELEENEYDYDLYDDEDDQDGDPVESETVIPEVGKEVKVFVDMNTESIPTKTTTKQSFEFISEAEETITTSTTTTTTTTTSTTSSTTTTTTETPTTFAIVEDTEPPLVITDSTLPPVTTPNISQELSTPFVVTVPSSTTSSTTLIPLTSQATTEENVITTTQALAPVVTEVDTTLPDTTIKTTTVRQVASTTTEAFVTEQVDPLNRNLPVPRNFKPYIDKRLQYMTVVAGKVFRFVIPKDTFKDAEDGYNLILQVLDENEKPLAANSWLQFNPLRRELYGLPLADDIHTWIYIVKATDKEGDFEQDQLTIQVQQHPLEKVFNHEFSLSLRIEKPQEYHHYIDWSLKVLRALGKIYSTNMSEITVRKINTVSEPAVFTWSNDSLPSNFCPRHEIQNLFKVLTANDRGDPSRELGDMLKSDLRVKTVSYRNLSTCIEQPPSPPVTAINNFSPVLRNPVDVVNATLGELLVVKVKDDTFYDPEDVDPAMLNITLQTSDFQPIPSNSWLQFDNKNREFFGIPRKTGVTQYWLMCVDSGSKSAKDSLEVHVRPAEKIHYNVEFSMTVEVPFETFSSSAALQKKFVEKLMDIFEESSPKNLHFLPFKAKRERDSFDSTVIYWFNKSLPVDRCPLEEIKRLEHMLHNIESKSISSRVHRIMAPDFTVSTIKVHHIGNCKAKPVIPTPDAAVPAEETTPPSGQNEYLITYIIPGVIISIMLFVASVAACVLYRKRRMGKMNVEEDGRQTYGNKGIPVIFQEELEEKPEPGTKAPVILKDERPPLAPPEYSKSGSVKLEDSEPYQPPPPFTRTQDNSRQPRPKPTPTYRKPPPYVPP